MGKPRKGENWTDHRLRTDFGMTTEDWDVLFKSQGNGCAICGSKNPGRKDNHWCLDHNHENGKPRGILCQNCNMGIGNFKDNRNLIKAAIKYLNGHSQ